MEAFTERRRDAWLTVEEMLGLSAGDAVTGTPGATTFLRGDRIWSTVSGSGIVDSVFGRTGVVVAVTNDYTWAQINKTVSDIADITTKSHVSLTGIGTNTHAQIDTHIAATGTAVHGLGTMSTQAASAVAITGGTIAGLTGLAIRDTSAAFDLTIAATSAGILTAARTLTIDVSDAARTIDLAGNLTVSAAATISGTNTGDQTITLTGGVTGSGTGSFAATVITNANLTGPITSIGNATSIAAQTGTGSTFVMQASPTLTTPVNGAATGTSLILSSTLTGVGGTHTAITGLGVRSTGTGAFDLKLANTENLTVSDKTLTVTLNNANRTLTVSGDATVTGSNTGDQTITLTGGVTGSGTGSFAATVITNANLTGPITSVGNATSVAAQTGTGTTFAMQTGPTFTAPVLGVASATSLATSAASPLLLTNGQLVTVALTSQTVGATTLTIPDFANVVDEFTFKTKSQTMSNKTFVAPALGTPASGVLTNCSGYTDANLSTSDVTTNNLSITKHGFAPKAPNVATQYLDGTGAWSTPAGAGTVTTVSVVTANGVSGSVANPTTTPAITLTLAAITPTTVTPSGLVDISAAGAGQIQFPATQNASAGANTLDDYEKGTWTPTDGSGAALTFTGVTARYTKIGRFVHSIVGLTYPATADVSSAQINGQPFSSGQDTSAPMLDNSTLSNMGYTNLGTIHIYLLGTFTRRTNAQMSGAQLFINTNWSV